MNRAPAALATFLAVAQGACAGAGGAGPRSPADDPAAGEILERTTPAPDGVPIHYRVAGRGLPALVLLHCWSCDAGYWEGTLQAFRSRRRVVAIDLAGHGVSGTGRERYTIPAFAADVRAVLDDLGLTRVVLVGHSMSGLVAIETARILPGRVAAVIPVDTLHDAEFQAPPDEFEAFLESLRQDFRTAAMAFVRGMFPEGTDDDLVETIAADMAAAPPAIAIAALRGVFAYDPTQALPQIQVPIRAINGDKYPTNLEANRRYAPQFDAVIMKGVGHFPMLEAPREFHRLLGQALDDLAPLEPAQVPPDPAEAPRR